ncbi:hypothetical protein B0T22DRAFT_280985 [Podospora appendiculata]|uniref:Uncharacterized protein n=1 Tax=Podospora appendiculata TaxID=314037 RepID=A0AAE0X0Q9_9PEZI|nr:hypothetical protein B0T22DRAFT_280985 [Podospora appendiculata]
METSLPKRRKVSLQAAVPLPAPTDTATPRESPPRPVSAAGKRPSFASPTRASLQRYNPDILRRRSSPPKKPGPEKDAVLPASSPTSTDSNESLSRALTAHLEQQSKAGNSNARESQLPLPIAARRPGPSQQQTAKPSPRPLPPPGPDDDEEILNPFGGRVLRRSPRAGVPSPEPELPPTPEHGDPVVSTPPSGIHNTPSKHPRRSRALAERLKSSSPLKQPPLRPPTKSQPNRPGTERLASQLNEPNALPPLTTAELRGLQPPDPDAEKKKARDSLLAEIAALERDLDLASTENERIRQAHLSKREPSPPTASTKDEILDLLRRRVLPPEKEADPDPSTAWLRSVLNPIAFLPFSKPTATPTPDPPVKDQPPPISHHPIAMTADEALPYLQVFTPLTFTSHISTLPRQPDSPSTLLLQRHSITATSTSPRGLFAAWLEMTVNTKTMAVTDVAVPRLDPAAVAELNPFIEQIVAKDSASPSSALANNISVLGWAMGEWLRVATQRAKVWCVLERELMGGKAALESMVARARTRRRRSQRQKQRRRRDDEGADSDDEDQDEEGEGGVGKYETAELLPFMGRTSMDFEIPVLGSAAAAGDEQGSTLRVLWRIEFDWTGEARSNIGVLVGVPGKWHKCDERGQLSGIPKMFDELIQGGDEPLTAVRTVVSLLAGEQGS